MESFSVCSVNLHCGEDNVVDEDVEDDVDDDNGDNGGEDGQ